MERREYRSFNSLKNSGNYMYHLLQHSLTIFFFPTECTYVFRMILTVNSVNQLIFVMVKCSVFFSVRPELLNIT
jgi:hypothetical protein